ncbi:DinB family protein [Pedobacter sp.]|uniref:DinB family protein n=1 Tax=Pedobacter sp. TaxID=1411316 RepID=UPI003D7F4AB6
MYRNINDFIADWQDETAATVKILHRITDDKRATIVHPHVRSLERLAWHITQITSGIGFRAGLFATDHLERATIPPSIHELTAVYEDYAAQLGKAVPSKWTDSALSEKVEMYGGQMAKGQVLHGLITHQCHHRGQMTVIMRMLDLPVPGIYGPSREEWADMGLEAPE